METASDWEEKEFLKAVCSSMLTLKRMSEKFSEKAKQMAETAPDEEGRKNMLLIYETAPKPPGKNPKHFMKL